MAKHWTEVKDEIENEIDKVWFDEPIEVTASRLGIFPSGAGAHGTCIGNLFFLISDNMALGWAMVEPAMYQAIADDTFTVEHCKRMFQYLDGCVTKLLGGKNEPECPAAWLNQPKTWKFYCDIVEAFDTIDNKKDLKKPAVELAELYYPHVPLVSHYFPVGRGGNPGSQPNCGGYSGKAGADRSGARFDDGRKAGGGLI